MLTVNTVSGKSPGGDRDLQSPIVSNSQRIDDYRSLYLQCAIIVQSFLSVPTLDTYSALYKLGCDDPALSHEIDKRVGYQLKISAYSQDDRFSILYHGPYIQAQMQYHHLSAQGAKSMVRQLLQISPELDLSQPGTSSDSAA